MRFMRRAPSFMRRACWGYVNWELMGKLMSIGRLLDCLSVCVSPAGSAACSCFCSTKTLYCQQPPEEEDEHELEKKPLIGSGTGQVLRLKDVVCGVEEQQTLALHLKPKTVVLKVSMHCHGCARKVEKHVSKMEGVTSYTIDLERKMVIVIGDLLPVEVLESISKVKAAQIWSTST